MCKMRFILKLLLVITICFKLTNAYAQKESANPIINQNGKGIYADIYQGNFFIDSRFTTLSSLFTYLDAGDTTNNIVSDVVLDNLYYFASGKTSNINFGIHFGGTTKNIDTPDKLKLSLIYITRLALDKNYKMPFKLVSYTPPATVLSMRTTGVIKPVPLSVITGYRLDNSTGFYQKYINLNGIPFFASNKTTDTQLYDLASKVNTALSKAPRILNSFLKRNQKVIVAGAGELGTIPGISPMKGGFSALAIDPVGCHATTSNTSFSPLAHEMIGHGSAASLRGATIESGTLDSTFFSSLNAVFQSEKIHFGGNHPYNDTSKTDWTVPYWYAGANLSEFWAETVAMYLGEAPTVLPLQVLCPLPHCNPEKRVPFNPPYKGPDDLNKLSPITYKFIDKYLGHNQY